MGRGGRHVRVSAGASSEPPPRHSPTAGLRPLRLERLRVRGLQSVPPTKTSAVGGTRRSPRRRADRRGLRSAQGAVRGARYATSSRSVRSIVRPGLIVGPHDPTGRFTYWPHRVSRGGEVLAPGSPQDPVQFIDVRDLADWIVSCVARRKCARCFQRDGVHDGVRRRCSTTCGRVTSSDATFTWVSSDWLLAAGLEAVDGRTPLDRLSRVARRRTAS